MDRRMAMTGLLLAVILVGLIATVNAALTPNYVHVCVHDCNGDPIESAKVFIEGDWVFPLEGTTNADGCYNVTTNSITSGGSMTVTVSYAGMVATKEVILGQGFETINFDFTLCPSVPALTPTGLIALVGLLTTIAFVTLVRKRH